MAELTPDQLEQKLAFLGDAGVRVARSAVLAGARLIAKKQQDGARVAVARDAKGTVRSTGSMRRSIKARNIRVTGQIAAAKSGFDVGRRKKDADPDTGATGHHGHLFIGGTVRRETGSVRIRIGRKVVGRKLTGNPVRNRGIMPASQPSFIKTAADAAQSEVAAVIKDKLINGIQRAVDNLGG